METLKITKTIRKVAKDSLRLPQFGAARVARERAELARMGLWRLRIYGLGVAVVFGITWILCGLLTLIFADRGPYIRDF
jgi:hypothetical protein